MKVISGVTRLHRPLPAHLEAGLLLPVNISEITFRSGQEIVRCAFNSLKSRPIMTIITSAQRRDPLLSESSSFVRRARLDTSSYSLTQWCKKWILGFVVA